MFIPIDMNTYPRREHFNYYADFIKCRYSMTYNIDITKLLFAVRQYNIKFYPTFTYICTKAINQNQEFRMTYNKHGELGYWDKTNPSYTVFHDDDKTFSDIWTDYNDNFSLFLKAANTDMENGKKFHGIKAKDNQPPNFFPISCVPWLSFTNLSIVPMNNNGMLFPIITIGKYFAENGKILLPFAISVAHEAADGYHTCKLINDIQNLADNYEKWLNL
jgi:Chloramphenicol O-acetyltransferase